MPAVPVVGSGRELLRPVYVTDVAEAALVCLEQEKVVGKTYMLGGADEVSLNEFMHHLAQARGDSPPAAAPANFPVSYPGKKCGLFFKEPASDRR